MHAIAEIIIPPTDDIKASVNTVMRHFIEEDDEGEKPEDGHADWWDFWVIGGRFSGNKIECQLDPEKLAKFHELLNKKKVTVSSMVCGKQELQPASQIPMVDALWREWFPGCGEKCILFNHSSNQYGRDGIEKADVCTVADIPERLKCSRLIIAGLDCDYNLWNQHFERFKKELGVVEDEKLLAPRHPNWQAAWQKAHDVTPKTELTVKRMWAAEYWNRVEHQETAFDGNVKKALADMRAKQRKEDKWPWCEWADDYLCVTVDYHD